LAQVITDNVGEMNKAMAATPQGKIQQLKNAWGDMQETIGQSLMSIGVKLAPTLQKIIPIVSKLADFVAPIIAKIGDTLIPIIDNLMNKFLIPNLPKIMQFMETLLSVGGQLFNDVISPILPILMEIFSAVTPLISALLPALGKAVLK
jgi:phage-related protein